MLKGIFKALCSFIMLLLATNAMADNYLVVKNNTGDQASFLIADNPEVTFTENEMRIGTFSIEKTSDLTLYFSDSPATTGISNMTTPQDSDVMVYDVTGRLIMKTKTKAGVTDIPFSSLPKGLYIIKQGALTMKITNR
jgi:hypothetical protein